MWSWTGGVVGGNAGRAHAGMVGRADRYYSTAQRVPCLLAAINTGTAPANSWPTPAYVAPSLSNLQEALHPDHPHVCSLHAAPAAGRPTAHDLGRARTEWRVPGHAGIGGGTYTVHLAVPPAQLHLLPYLTPVCAFQAAPIQPISASSHTRPSKREPRPSFLCRSCCPTAYRRHAPALRLAFVLYAFSFPVFSSLPAMEAFVGPAPSKLPFLNVLLDGYRVWLGARTGVPEKYSILQ